MNYNLLEEEWIPVLWRDGRTSRVGIIDALTKAGQIRQIAASNSMDRVAILRFLLALLYWCKGNPLEEIPEDSFPPDWFTRLNDNKECFNLLGEGKRFYQDHTAKRTQAVTNLIQEIPSGNNFWHFRHSTDKKDGLCPACCAMGLLRLPLFSVSGLSGPGEPNLMAGINGTPPVYVVPWGKSLFNTLLANWTKSTNIGEPSWIQPGFIQSPNNDVPLLTGLTLLPRRVFLHDPVNKSTACIGCGEKTVVILTCEFQTTGKQENDKWNDPHVVYLDSKPRKTLRAQDLTEAGKRQADGSLNVKFRMDRPWPDLIARIVETRKSTSLLIVGFATKKAKNVDVWERIIDMPLMGLNPETTVPLIKKWQIEGKRLEKHMGRSKIKGPVTIAAIRPHVENKVSAKASELITGGDEVWEQAASEYGPMMDAVAKSLCPGYTTVALQMRKKIAGAKPNIVAKNKGAKKPVQKKGGDE